MLPLCLAFAAACGSEGVVEVDPDPDPPPQDDPRLEIHVTVADEDASALSPLGWGAGVPGAVVRYSKIDQRTYYWNTAHADDEGRVVLEDADPGFYWIAAERSLSATEADALTLEGSAVGVLAGGEKVSYGGTAPLTLEVPLRLDRPGSLVISEVHMNTPPSWETGDTYYIGSMYVELHNNADTVAHLDGMVLGWIYYFYNDTGQFGHHTCAETESMRNDPEGVWSVTHYQFPGSGAEHPVAPGQTVIVAVSATDHTGVHPDLLDLSEAGFEFLPGGFADNPAAPNLIDVGIRAGGLWGLDRAFMFLSAPVDVESLPLRPDPGANPDLGVVYDYRRFPWDRVLDVAFVWWDSSESNLTILPFCHDPVHPDFDRIPGGYIKVDEERLSAQRRLLPTLGGGDSRLLDTGTSRVDFVKAEVTPGWVP